MVVWLLLVLMAVAVAEDGPGAELGQGDIESHAPTVVTDWAMAFSLPAQAQAWRDLGVSQSDVEMALLALRRAGIPADQGARVLQAAVDGHRTHGALPRPGLFVIDRVAKGHRGASLVAEVEGAYARRSRGSSSVVDDSPASDESISNEAK